ncbi:MAG TPA: hypothetical protein VGC55_04365 [Dokdonella sp.]
MAHPRIAHHRLARAAAFFTLAFAAGASAASPAPETDANFSANYTYQTLDYPGASSTIIWGLNDFGELAGQYSMNGLPSHAMAYRNGRFESLDPDGLFDDRTSAAGGPTEFGMLFGAYTDPSQRQHGFLLHGSQVETVDFPGHLNANVDGVSPFGAIAGVYWDADGVFHGMLRRYGHDTPIDVAGARDTYPLGINADGEIVGYWDNDPAEVRGFRRSANGQFSWIDVPSAGPGGTVAFAVNDVGQTAGYYVDSAGLIHGFIEARGRFKTLDMPGVAATIVTAINNFGVIAGEYFDATGKRHGFVATPW